MKLLKNILLGGGKGLISPLIETFNLFKKLKSSEAFDFLDTNHDGKFDIEDVKNLQWETLGKIAGIGVLIYLAELAGILDLF